MTTSEILAAEIENHKNLINKNLPKAEKAFAEKAISEKALDTFNLADRFIKKAESDNLCGDYKNALYYLLRSVANYYMALGDKGVLRENQS